MRIAAFILLSVSMAFSQSWTGILDPPRVIDWSTAGLPAIFPNGETTPNPWTPPTTRTQCATSQCNTVSGGSVTAATINAAITSAAAGTYVLIPAGTFNCAGTVNLNKNYITLRGSGAATTKLTGCTIQIGDSTGNWGGASFLTANPSRLATSITVASPPSAGRLAMMEECDHNHSSTDAAGMTHFSGGSYAAPCNGTYVDPVGPWVCAQTTGHICNFQSGGTQNPHFQTHVQWIPAGGVSGNTVNLTTPLWNGDWTTSRSVVLTWLNISGTVGAGAEALTIEGGGIDFTNTYACWFKGIREIGLSSGLILTDVQFSAHTLIANSYIAETQTSTGNYLVRMGFDGGERGESDTLFINNTLEGGFIAGFGDQVGDVYAYYYMRNGGNSAFMSNGFFNHHGGTSYLLQEGVQGGRLLEDQTWSTHNFNTFFRNYLNCTDPVFPSSSPFAIKLDPYARFENLIGNAMGGGSGCGSSYGSVLTINPNTSGTGGSWPTGDPTGLTSASAMIWGNYTACSGGDSHCNTTGAAIFASADVPSNLASFGANSTPYQNSVPVSTSLPASFFMNSMAAHPSGGTGLNWWRACDTWTTFPTDCAHFTTSPFPTAGPDVTGGPFLSGHAYNNPAAIAWAGFPADSNYTTAWGQNLKQFDERAFLTDPSGNSSGINLSPALGFGTQKVGITSGNQNLILTSNGTLALSILNITKSGTNSGDFSMTHNCPIAPSTLAPSSTCQINVTFTPSATGSRTATVTVTSDAPTSPNTANLSGTGTAPAVSLSPTTVSFGSVTAGTNSPGMGTQLSNSGDAVLAISSVSITGTDSSQFSILSNTCGATLAPSTSCTITARFSPSISGAKSASISVVDDATGSPHSVPLSGTGTPNPSPTTTITTGGGITVTGGITIK